MGCDLGCSSQSSEWGSNWINTQLGGGRVEIECLPGLCKEKSYYPLNRRQKWGSRQEVVHRKRSLEKQDVSSFSSLAHGKEA